MVAAESPSLPGLATAVASHDHFHASEYPGVVAVAGQFLLDVVQLATCDESGQQQYGRQPRRSSSHVPSSGWFSNHYETMIGGVGD
jgi:hypothetical protein